MSVSAGDFGAFARLANSSDTYSAVLVPVFGFFGDEDVEAAIALGLEVLEVAVQKGLYRTMTVRGVGGQLAKALELDGVAFLNFVQEPACSDGSEEDDAEP
jgi:hypothetical protein